MSDLTGVLVSLGGGISRESNIGDSDNTRDGGTIVGGRIDGNKKDQNCHCEILQDVEENADLVKVKEITCSSFHCFIDKDLINLVLPDVRSIAVDNNLSQPSAFTPMDTELHKEVQQAAGGPTSLGVIKNNASGDFTAEVNPELSAPNDYVPHQQGPDEGSKNYTIDHIFAGTNLSVLVDKTNFAGDGSQTAHIVSGTNVDTRIAFKDDEDQEDKPFITLEESSKEHAERNKDTHVEPKITSVPPPSPTSVKIQLQAQILLLKS
nr:hypothetical protein [Tanacetum cinerariifolium]